MYYQDNEYYSQQGLFKRKTWLEKMGRDNPMMLVALGLAVGAGGVMIAQKLSNKKKRR